MPRSGADVAPVPGRPGVGVGDVGAWTWAIAHRRLPEWGGPVRGFVGMRT
jgi:hypothetical protein